MNKLFIFFLVALTNQAFAGGDKGHGGIVVECGDQVELADFHEVRVLPGLSSKIQIVQYKGDHFEIARQKLEEYSKIISKDRFHKFYRKELDQLKNVNWMQDSLYWNSTDDLGIFPNDKKCNEPVNVIHYFEKDYIFGNQSLFDRMSTTAKAGLLVHEVLYSYHRMISKDIKSSLMARRANAILFSNLSFERKKYILANLLVYMESNGVESKSPTSPVKYIQLKSFSLPFTLTLKKLTSESNINYLTHHKVGAKIDDLTEMKSFKEGTYWNSEIVHYTKVETLPFTFISTLKGSNIKVPLLFKYNETQEEIYTYEWTRSKNNFDWWCSLTTIYDKKSVVALLYGKLE